jgi:hypothetical protein
MEEELQMPSCLFGGPPVQDDMIKLGESQIGFMNIFARPLFEAVTDILPAMRFAVDEILINKGIWETKIDQEKQRRKNKAPMHLSLLNASFAPDPTPSPFSGGPNRPPNASVPAPTTVPEETGRRLAGEPKHVSAWEWRCEPHGDSRHAHAERKRWHTEGLGCWSRRLKSGP